MILAAILFLLLVFGNSAQAGPLANAGEWITRDDDGSKVCRLVADVHAQEVFHPSLCGDWQGHVAQAGEIADPRWYRCRSYMTISLLFPVLIPMGCQIHLERGWVP